jgi:hypothetical protein
MIHVAGGGGRFFFSRPTDDLGKRTNTPGMENGAAMTSHPAVRRSQVFLCPNRSHSLPAVHRHRPLGSTVLQNFFSLPKTKEKR